MEIERLINILVGVSISALIIAWYYEIKKLWKRKKKKYSVDKK